MNVACSKIRISVGSAGLLGLKKVKQKALPTTIYLMNSGGCVHNCSFCAQAKKATSRQDKLSRVSWPEFSLDQALIALKNKKNKYKRICLQIVNTSDIFQELPELIKQIKSANPKAQLAVNIRTMNVKDIDAVFKAGANQVGLSIDAVNNKQFKNIKGGSLEIFKKIVAKAAKKHSNKIATHLIVGMGETEKEMVQAISELNKYKVIIGLFAFTPVPGSKLEFKKPPSLSHYRRIQVALYLIKNNYKINIKYNKKNQIIDFGVAGLEKILAKSDAFETSGCKDCNRPYYNEKASDKQLYNYPYKVRESEFANIFKTIYD